MFKSIFFKSMYKVVLFFFFATLLNSCQGNKNEQDVANVCQSINLSFAVEDDFVTDLGKSDIDYSLSDNIDEVKIISLETNENYLIKTI